VTVILAISHHKDGETAAVLHELARLHAQAQLLDLADFPRSLEIGLTFEGAETRRFLLRRRAGPEIDLARCRAVWWRRPQPFVLHPELTRPEYQNFAYSESHEAFAGLWQAIEPFWVNHPTRDEVAHRKALQLRVAQEAGLAIPRTLISNDVAAIRQFVAQHGAERTVYKSFSATERHWRETRTLKPQEVDLLESARYAPVIFQEYIPAQYDLRITAVGEELFPAAIYSQTTSYPVDYRMDFGASVVEAVHLPDDVAAGLLALLRRLGLVYGAIDMRLTPDGRYVFLEINPAGQWLFIESRTGQPITARLASVLASHDAD
jgi:glutathione synthase/RimK-type ligase-like ATP-grasp enzyme